jgi:hypothetical protein
MKRLTSMFINVRRRMTCKLHVIKGCGNLGEEHWRRQEALSKDFSKKESTTNQSTEDELICMLQKTNPSCRSL